MSQKERVAQQAEKLISDLQGITDEISIRKITLKHWEPIIKEFRDENSIKLPRSVFRKTLEAAFPQSHEAKPGYYRTSAGKGKVDRYEHLSLWYATTNVDRWEIVGDAARTAYRENLKQFPEKKGEEVAAVKPQPIAETEQIEQTKQSTRSESVASVKTLKLDPESEVIVADALRHLGMSLPVFIQQACKVYAKTVMGKVGEADKNLANVSTKDLLESPKFNTHPRRAEELTKRAIEAMRAHNDNCTESSQRWKINQTTIQALTGSRPESIKKVIDKYREVIDSHNSKYWTSEEKYPNRKGGNRKIENEISIAELVPDGLDLQDSVPDQETVASIASTAKSTWKSGTNTVIESIRLQASEDGHKTY